MAYLGAGCGKELNKDGLRVYYDLLGDLPLTALQCAAKRALLENAFPVFPQVGTLRKLATEAMTAERVLWRRPRRGDWCARHCLATDTIAARPGWRRCRLPCGGLS